MMGLPCGRSACVGGKCGNFNDPSSKWFKAAIKPGCMGGAFPPWSYADRYLARARGEDSFDVTPDDERISVG